MPCETKAGKAMAIALFIAYIIVSLTISVAMYLNTKHLFNEGIVEKVLWGLTCFVTGSGLTVLVPALFYSVYLLISGACPA